MVFHPDGACIFGGSTDLLKVYGWEPSRCFDSVNMSWGKVADMAMAQTQLVGKHILLFRVNWFKIVHFILLQPCALASFFAHFKSMMWNYASTSCFNGTHGFITKR